jgi:hypothetical protein
MESNRLISNISINGEIEIDASCLDKYKNPCVGKNGTVINFFIPLNILSKEENKT